MVIITPDRVGPTHAGIALRHIGMARALARRGWDVVLAATDVHSTWGPDDFRFTTVDAASVTEVVRGARACIVQGTVLAALPVLQTLDVPIIVDLICPIFLENLERYRGRLDGPARVETDLDLFHEALAVGDAFICGSPVQRHFWMGMLAAHGRLTIDATQDDRDLGHMLCLVPFGVPDEPPHRTAPILRGVVPGIGNDDIVAWWGGGLWSWLDPETPIRAVAALADECPRLKLVFTGLRRPQDPEGINATARRAMALAQELGVTGRSVFFVEGWTPADRLGDLVLESDLAVTAHQATLETTFAVRTRFWTYLWGGLPMVASSGDWGAQTIADDDLGMGEDVGDVDGYAAALRRLTDSATRRALAANVTRTASQMGWDEAVAALDATLRRGLRARTTAERDESGVVPAARVAGPVGLNLQKFRAAMADEGLGTALRKSWKKIARRPPPPDPTPPQAAGGGGAS